MPIITTPRPPLNLFQTARVTIGPTLKTILDVPEFRVPASGPNPEQTIKATAILTSLVVVNTSETANKVQLRVVEGSGDEYFLAAEEDVDAKSTIRLLVNRQNVQSGELLRVGLLDPGEGQAHLSYILNQTESYEVIG